MTLILLFFVLGGIFWLYILKDLPSPQNISTGFSSPSIRITDRNGKLLYEAFQQNGGRHLSVKSDQIPYALKAATVATEDRSFYSNSGVDWRGIIRAGWINLKQGRIVAGGSTITQQIARNLLLGNEEKNERTVVRKIKEIILALELARYYSKEELLTLYLNHTYYGAMAYGVEAAAQTYFGKPVEALSLAESAVIAGIPQAPALYNPYTNPDKAKQRQKTVLELMEKQGVITPEERKAAEEEPLVYSSTPYPMEAPHFVLMVRDQLDELLSQCGSSMSDFKTGIVVRTTLNLDWQKTAENAIKKHLDTLQSSVKSSGYTKSSVDHHVTNGALVAIDAKSGEVLALVGSKNYFDQDIYGAVNMATALRQPGSALKPFIYAAAFDKPKSGPPWTPATMILDVITNFTTQKGEVYTPKNYDNLEHGPVLVRQALASSLNIPAVIALDYVGEEEFIKMMKGVGMDTLGDPEKIDLSLALGGGEISLLDLTNAYAVFAKGGVYKPPLFVLDIKAADGTVIYSTYNGGSITHDVCMIHNSTLEKRVMDERIAWLISDILSDDDARILGFGRNSILRIDRPAAVKTGTTSNFHDNWTVGYTPSLVVGVWVGNTDHTPMRDISGISGAGPIWHEFIRSVLQNMPKEQFIRPNGLVQVEICSLSGLLPTSLCPYKRLEWFIEGTQPTRYDNIYQEVSIDVEKNSLASDETPPWRIKKLVVLDLPYSALGWAQAHNVPLLLNYVNQVDVFGDERSLLPEEDKAFTLEVTNPKSNAIFI